MANIEANYHEDVKDPELRIMLLVCQLRLFEAIAQMRLENIDELLRSRHDAVRIANERLDKEAGK